MRLIPWPAQVEAIEHVVPNREAATGACRWRHPHPAIADVKDVRHAIFDRFPTRFEHLQNRWGRDILRIRRPRLPTGTRQPGNQYSYDVRSVKGVKIKLS